MDVLWRIQNLFWKYSFVKIKTTNLTRFRDFYWSVFKWRSILSDMIDEKLHKTKHNLMYIVAVEVSTSYLSNPSQFWRSLFKSVLQLSTWGFEDLKRKHYASRMALPPQSNKQQQN